MGYNYGTNYKIYKMVLLVGGFNHMEKYQSMGKIIRYIMENKTCQPDYYGMNLEVPVCLEL